MDEWYAASDPLLQMHPTPCPSLPVNNYTLFPNQRLCPYCPLYPKKNRLPEYCPPAQSAYDAADAMVRIYNTKDAECKQLQQKKEDQKAILIQQFCTL
eukprot:6451140-Ditylum_brightwellii.AAC.1